MPFYAFLLFYGFTKENKRGIILMGNLINKKGFRMLKEKRFRQIACAVLTIACAVTLVSCSGKSADEIADPLEGVNRTIFKVNTVGDQYLFEPIAKGYRFITPKPLRTMIGNFLRNLNSPVIIGNELLQGDIKGAGNTTGRMVVNTLAGFGGIFDFASDAGMAYQPEDFGQTLAVWGLEDGLYLMLPLLGPSSLRDATGRFVDSYADPLRTYLFNIEEDHLHYTRIGGEVVSQREELIEVINDLRRNSFDYYAAVRSAYYQQRQSAIADGEMNAFDEFDDF